MDATADDAGRADVTFTWLSLAAGLALLGGGTHDAARVPPAAAMRSPTSLRTLKLLGGGGCVVASVVALGVMRGAVAAVVLAPLAVVVVGRLDARPRRARASPTLALALDLVAAALVAGQPLAAALVLAAPAAGGSAAVQLARVGSLLRLGADPVEAWRAAADDPVLAPVAAAARRSAASGIRLASAFEQLGTDLRAQRRVAAQARAQRAGVFAAAPLGLCFLPSFVCLGIIPIVVGVAGGVLGGLG